MISYNVTLKAPDKACVVGLLLGLARNISNGVDIERSFSLITASMGTAEIVPVTIVEQVEKS